ncbi:hypothetical protein GS426_12595 [Rhodococcus hoagii]|nr:hypothetical protein [Prescottella equi]
MVSPAPLAADRRSADWRDVPGHTDPLTSKLASTIGGPVGRHALIGRTRFFTPMRVILLLAVVFLALGWFTKAGCIQQAPVGADGALGLDWSGNRQYVAMCYSDTVPLYGAEHLDEGAFPYKKWWEEPRSDGSIQQRYMEYPVLSGLYQYGSMVVAKAWDATPWLPGGLQVAIYFNVVAFGLAMAWLVTVWASALLAGRRVWDAALVACSPLVIVHAFTNFDPLATAFAMGACWRGRANDRCSRASCSGWAARQTVPADAARPAAGVVSAVRTDARLDARDARGGRRVAGGESADRAAVPALVGPSSSGSTPNAAPIPTRSTTSSRRSPDGPDSTDRSRRVSRRPC